MGLTLVTGGARSGKSTFAEKLVKEFSIKAGVNGKEGDVLYIATAIPFDDEMKDRIRRHQAQRPDYWRTVEAYRDLDQVIKTANENVILLDCITVMVTNLLFAGDLDEDNPDRLQVEKIEAGIMAEINVTLNAVQNISDSKEMCEVVFVTNELGLGLVPAYPLGRIFRDIAGRVNQRLAEASDQVYFVVSGIPMLIKGDERK
ncbi:MAG: bifunctional adenosylcobinamide kinase/adenosylcobinamide-phosphate guanylyltransferase [Halanaerobiales bacterium]|nr:bifunctional adenosylcobinamide kinase/adenosylcobinamide-phosphate guanylyltransferase [Halanaerobiales bacterium]